MRKLLMAGTAAVALFVASGVPGAAAGPNLAQPSPSPSPSASGQPGKAATTLTLTTSAKVVSYGAKLAVTTQLSSTRDVEGAKVEVFGKAIGKEKLSLGVFPVNSDGLFVGEIQMYSSTIFSSVFNGNKNLQASSSNRATTKVRVILESRIAGNYGRSDGRKLFHEGDEVFMATRVNPSHPGMKVENVIQRQVDGDWKVTEKVAFKMDDQGLATGSVLLSTRGLYRTRAVFEGDADHLGAASRWREFVVTA